MSSPNINLAMNSIPGVNKYRGFFDPVRLSRTLTVKSANELSATTAAAVPGLEQVMRAMAAPSEEPCTPTLPLSTPLATRKSRRAQQVQTFVEADRTRVAARIPASAQVEHKQPVTPVREVPCQSQASGGRIGPVRTEAVDHDDPAGQGRIQSPLLALGRYQPSGQFQFAVPAPERDVAERQANRRRVVLRPDPHRSGHARGHPRPKRPHMPRRRRRLVAQSCGPQPITCSNG